MLQCARCGRQFSNDVMVCPNDHTPLQADATIADVPLDPLLGRVFDGKYRLDERLGSGGMGTVYRATHLLIDRPVALKVLSQRFVGDQTAQTMTSRLVNARSATPMQNKAELITRASLPTTILPTAANDPQAVKARREVVARAMSSVSQTRVWNVLIDVVAQSGHFKPNASNLQNDFIVEGEQHYWVHVAIDRFTGQVIDKQIEVVNE